MDAQKFKEVESIYQALNERLKKGEITAEEMKQELKRMMIQDETGGYWMLGGKTGKWYVYRGVEWKEDNPYKEEVKVDSEFEVEIEVEEDPGRTQLFQQEQQQDIKLASPLDTIALDTTQEETRIKLEAPLKKEEKFEIGEPVKHEAVQKKVSKTKEVKEKGEELVITAIDMVSLIFFLGGIGLVVGVLFGATFGIFTGVFGELINYFPEILQGTQGGLAGGLIFAAIGGIGGFILFAIAAAVITSIYNLISYIFGGIRFKIK